MNLSEKKQFTNEFDFRVLTLYETLVSYNVTFTFPDKIRVPLEKFIDFLDREVYHDLPTKKDVELLGEKFFVTAYYKEIL